MAYTISEVPMPGTWPQSGTMQAPEAAAFGDRSSWAQTTSLLPPRSVIPQPQAMAARVSPRLKK